MTARKHDRAQGAGGGRPKAPAQRTRRNRGKGAGHTSANRSSRNNRSRRRKPQVNDGLEFWGDPSQSPAARTEVRITSDPTAVVRSLGAPPLPGHETIAEAYFVAVYGRALTTAGALAAAGGLIDPAELTP